MFGLNVVMEISLGVIGTEPPCWLTAGIRMHASMHKLCDSVHVARFKQRFDHRQNNDKTKYQDFRSRETDDFNTNHISPLYQGPQKCII